MNLLQRRREMMKSGIQLPSGYTRLKLLTNHNNAYFYTGVQRSNDTSQLIDIEAVIRWNADMIGYMGTDYGCFFGCCNKTWVNAQTNASAFPIEEGRIYNVLMFRDSVDTQTLFVDNEPIIVRNMTLSNRGGVYLFNIGPYTNAYYSKCSLGRTKIYKARELVRDYIPCISPSGEYGMFDLVEQTFKGSDTKDNFTGE